MGLVEQVVGLTSQTRNLQEKASEAQANLEAVAPKDPSAYAHLKITCYGNDKFKAHSAFEVNVEDKTIDVSRSEVTSPGDRTLPARTWQTIPGGLKREIVMAERFSTHVTAVNDKKLRYLLMDTIFQDGDEKKAACAEILKTMDHDTDQTKLIAAVFLVFSFILGYGGLKLIIDLLGVLYPAYMSLRYNPQEDPEDAVQWLSYWLIFYTSYMAEGLMPIVFEYIPYYYSMKMGLFVWLCHPDTKGAKVAFNQLVKPRLVKKVD